MSKTIVITSADGVDYLLTLRHFDCYCCCSSDSFLPLTILAADHYILRRCWYCSNSIDGITMLQML